MRLLSCHIDNFGKLHDFRMDFSEGVNVINEENGWGKSTLATFLKAMLFGLENQRKAETDETERKGYLPWQGGRYGGELDIEVDGKTYRISRTFGVSERLDTFRLIDLETGRDSNDYSSNIGAEIFDLDRKSFKKTIFIAQNDCETGSSESISAKLGNLTEASEEVTAFEHANSVIMERLNQLSPANKSGSLMTRKNVIAQLQREKNTQNASDAQASLLQDKISQKKKQYQELIAIRNEYAKYLIGASEEGRKKEIMATYERMNAELEEKTKAMEDCAATFLNGIPGEEIFDECQSLISQLREQHAILEHLALSEQEKHSLSDYSIKMRAGIPKDEELNEMMARASMIAKSEKKKNNLENQVTDMQRLNVKEQVETFVDPTLKKTIWSPIGIAILFAGLAIAACGGFGIGPAQIMMIAGGAIAVLGIILIIVGVTTNRKLAEKLAHRLESRDRRMQERAKPIHEIEQQIAELTSQISDSEAIMEEILSNYSFLDENLPYKEQVYDLWTVKKRYQDLLDKEKKYMDANQDCVKMEQQLMTYAGILGISYGPNIAAEVSFLKSKAAEHVILSEEWRKQKQKVHSFLEMNPLDQITPDAKAPYTMDELHTMIYEADTSIENLRNSINQNAMELEDLQQQLDYNDDKAQELANQKEIQEKELREYEILELTRHYLVKSKEQYTARYMGPITKAFSYYYEILTGHASDAWMIDADLSLKLRQSGKMRESKWLSAGYRDLLGVCMRMAMVDAMFTEEKPFLVFDDPYVNLDDEKLENGKRLLEALGNKYQLIYFTCHESRQV